MMSSYKEDINEAKERLKAWWDHEKTDRPCIIYWTPRPEIKYYKVEDIVEYFMPFFLAKNWDSFEQALESFENTLKIYYFGAENIPRFFPNYGPGIMASVFGAVPKYQSGTVWFKKDTAVEEIVSLLENVKLDRNNTWYDRLIRITEYAAKRAGKEYSIALTDLGGVLDILSSFLGPTNIILTMKRKPEIIDTCRAIILEKLLRVYDDLQSIIEQYGDGCNSWIPIWCHKRWYPIQCDFGAMLSPKYFKRFVLPDIITQAEHMDYGIFHLDGPKLLPHLDYLLAEPSITGIQWVPGAGAEPSHDQKWMPIYKKIQAAGKNLIVDNPGETPKSATRLYKKLDPKGLIMSLLIFSKTETAYFLPEFLGGNGAEGDYKTFRKIYRKTIRSSK